MSIKIGEQRWGIRVDLFLRLHNLANILVCSCNARGQASDGLEAIGEGTVQVVIS